MSEKKYSAGIMAQAFWVKELKQCLNLIKTGYSTEEIKREVIE